MSRVVLENIKKVFGKNIALRSLDLTIPEGSLVSLLGPSGCGKTTALRIIAGLLRADQGRVLFDNLDISTSSPAERDIGMVFQAYSLFPNMNASENVEFGLRTRKLASEEIRRRVDQVFETINLSAHQKKYPHQLSGGQQQRIALARAIVIRPRILLLDEPLSALDAQVRDQLREEIRRVQREFKITTLFVTHDQEEAMTISDQVGVMNQGELLQIDRPEVIYNAPNSPVVARFIGMMNEIPATISGVSASFLGTTCAIAPQSQYTQRANCKALVRPESLMIGEPHEKGASGSIANISFVGPLSMVYIRLDGGIEVKVAQSSASSAHLTQGSRVTVKASLPQVMISN